MPGAAVVLPAVDDHLPAGQHGLHLAGDRHALVRRVVHVHVVRAGGQRLRAARVVDDDVRVRAGRDDALARVQPEHPGRRGGGHLHPAGQRQLPGRHALVQQVHPVLHAGHPVGDLGEVAAAEFLLLLEAERAVVGGHHGQVVGAQPAPQRALVLPRPQRRRGHVLGALEVRPGQVVQGQVQVLRAGLGEHVLAGVPGLGDRLQRLGGRQVHDVQRGAGHLGQGDRPVGGLGLQLRRPGQAVLHRVGPPRGQRLGHQLVDRDAVLRVHHDHRAGVRGPQHGPQDLAVGGVEHARVGHEHLEAVHARADAGLHLLERGVVDVGDDHVEAVVDRAVAVRLRVPLVQRGQQRGALGLDREVDDRGGAAPGGGPGPGLEGVRRERAAERHLHVRVHVDAAGQHVPPGGVEHPVRRLPPRTGPARCRGRPAR